MPRFADSWFHPHDLGNYFSNIEYLRAPCHGDLILIISCAMIMGTSLWPIMSKIQCWNLTTATLKPCYCHAGTLLLPRWNLATATLEPCYWPCYCHAGTLLLPRCKKNKLYIYIYIYFQFFKFKIVHFCFLIFICLFFLLHFFSLFVFCSFHFYILYWPFCFVFCFKYCFCT